MTKRKGISKGKRFDIFKRDGFVCQYCGKHPPETILEVDHIVPVSKGGDNEEYNLVTACQDCNRGKSDGDLSLCPQSLKEKSEKIKEAEEQILGYQKIIYEQKQRLENEAFDVLEYIGLSKDEGEYRSAKKAHLTSIKTFIQKLGFFTVMEAAEISFSKFPGAYSHNTRLKYLCGICWNRVRERQDG